MSKNIIIIIVIAAAVIVGGVIIANNKKCDSLEGVITAQEAAANVIQFVNVKILAGQAEATLKDVSEEDGLYKIKFNIQDQEAVTYSTKNGKLFFPEWIDLTVPENDSTVKETTIGSFTVNEGDFCNDNGKPIVYFFGSESCSHCQWEHPIIEEVAAKFGDYISFHNNMDTDADNDVFQKYSTGSIPALVLGCRYSRIGSGENVGQEVETQNLTAVICKLTDGQPENVCSEVQELINQVK